MSLVATLQNFQKKNSLKSATIRMNDAPGQFPRKRPRDEGLHTTFTVKALPQSLKQSRSTDDDHSIVVLCAFRTLLAPVQQVGMGMNGQVPCEAQFIAIKPDRPSEIIVNAGFIFIPPIGSYSQKKNALDSLAARVRGAHGIDPRTSFNQRELWKKAALSRSDVDTHVCTSVNEVALVMDRVISAVDCRKESQDATTVFLTSSQLLKEAQQSFLWMQSQSRMKLSKIQIKELRDCFPSIDDSVMALVKAESAVHERSQRCVVHPPESLSEFGLPFTCCRFEAFKLLKAVQILCDAIAEVSSEGRPEGEADAGAADNSDGDDSDDAWWEAELQRMEKGIGNDTVTDAVKAPQMVSAQGADDLEENDNEEEEEKVE